MFLILNISVILRTLLHFMLRLTGSVFSTEPLKCAGAFWDKEFVISQSSWQAATALRENIGAVSFLRKHMPWQHISYIYKCDGDWWVTS